VIASLAAAAVGFGAAFVAAIAGRGVFAHPVLARTNYRGRSVPTAGGALAVFAVIVVAAGRALLGAFGAGRDLAHTPERFAVLAACCGFALLGLVDDLLGSDTDRGFRGHVRALATGRITTGVVKIVGGGALAVALVAAVRPTTSAARLLADALVVALAANMANLFDRAPGRAIKAALISWVPIALIARGDAVGVATATVVGAFTGLLPDDLCERLMLGDTGAYALGGVLGLAVVLETSTMARVIVLLALIALTVTAEFVSFGRVIDRVAPLRFVDRLGRLRPPEYPGA
jgi:UDP-N-acetylmuramyl pentapeptide phosphotransferase/UDP-N-acetylglucosamine-1-phosphate transferase